MGARQSDFVNSSSSNAEVSNRTGGDRKKLGAKDASSEGQKKAFEHEDGADKVLHSVAVMHSCPQIIAYGGNSQKVTVLNWTKSETLACFRGPQKAITQVSGAHGPSCVYAASRDCRVYGWSVDADSPGHLPPDPVTVLKGHSLPVASIAASPGHRDRLCSGGRDTAVKLWDTTTQKCVKDKSISRNIVTQLQWIGSEMSVMQCSEDRTVKIWDVRNMEAVQVLQAGSIMTCCDVSSDGNLLATGGRGSHPSIMVWDRRNGKCLAELSGGHISTVAAVKFTLSKSPPPSGLISCSEDGFVKMWELDSGSRTISDPILSQCVPSSGGLTSMELFPNLIVACTSLEAGLSVWKLNQRNGTMSLLTQY